MRWIPTRGVDRRWLMALIVTPFCLTGTFCFWNAAERALAGDRAGAVSWLTSALLLCGVGFVLLAGEGFARRKLERDRRVRERYSDEPWNWRADWKSGRIRGRGRVESLAACGIALIWNLIAIPVTLSLGPALWRQGDLRLVLLSLLPLTGLGLLLWALRAALRQVRFGPSVFEMDDVPGVVGHGLIGVVRARLPGTRAESIQLRLVCVRRRVTGNGNGRRPRETVLWQEKRLVDPQEIASVGGDCLIPVGFRLPSDVPESDDADPADRCIWRLLARVTLPGIDHLGRFEVPVFRTAESDSPTDAGVFAHLRRRRALADYEPPADSRILVREEGASVTVRFPAARNITLILWLTLSLSLWTGFLWMTANGSAPLPFRLAFGAVELVLIAALSRMLLLSRHVTVRPGEIVSGWRWLGLGRTRRVGEHELREVRVHTAMRSRYATFHDVCLGTVDGRRFTLGGSIPDRQEADWIATRIGHTVRSDRGAQVLPFRRPGTERRAG